MLHANRSSRLKPKLNQSLDKAAEAVVKAANEDKGIEGDWYQPADIELCFKCCSLADDAWFAKIGANLMWSATANTPLAALVKLESRIRACSR